MFEIRSLEFGFSNFGVWDIGLGVLDLGFGFLSLWL